MLDDRNLRFDLLALALLAFTIFLGVSVLTYSPADPIGEAVPPLNQIYQPRILVYPQNTQIHNACGRMGAMAADVMLRTFGLGAYYFLICLAAVDVWLLMRRPIQGPNVRLIGWLASLVGGVTFLQMFVPLGWPVTLIGPGGIVGALGRSFLESHFATAGSLILLTSLIACGLLLCTDYVLLRVAILTVTLLLNAMPRSQGNVLGKIGRWLGYRRSLRGSLAMAGAGSEPVRHPSRSDRSQRGATTAAASLASTSAAHAELHPELTDDGVAIRIRGRRVDDLVTKSNSVPGPDLGEDEVTQGEVEEEEYEEYEYEYEDGEEEAEDDEESTDVPNKASLPVAADSQLHLREPSSGSEREEVMAQLDEASREHDPQDYELPPIDLLIESETYSVTELKREVQRKAAILEKTFQDFNLDVKVVDIETGPVIAQYEIELKRGLKLSKITGLADDLAIALRVPSVRIVAPIPGKNTVGIEVPNDQRQVVRLREVMEEVNSRVKRMSIPIFLGKDVSGNPLAVDLASLPHLLIAGRTGTGKSVCLNAIISSILMTKTPDDVRMLMIDPKMVELSGYARLPHLMHPVVTDMRKAEAILAWACEKMDERYQLLARAGVRHVSVYNQLGEEELMERLQPESEDERRAIPRHLPFIVIVADEMADLMMTAGKEVEAHIIRLAAKSRAVGIHLILATQKPTVDVITGLIKSNLPARIAFQVASRIDSRVVLDEMGADKLLGNGDMLFLWPGTSTLLRGQGTYLSDEEITRIVDYCGSKGEQNFVHELVQLKVEAPVDGEVVGLKKRDDVYEEAVDIVIREGRGSVSLLQRNLQIGYGRAARLIDFMAEDGIVGTYNGSQAREVLISIADWEAMRTGGKTHSSSTSADTIPFGPAKLPPHAISATPLTSESASSKPFAGKSKLVDDESNENEVEEEYEYEDDEEYEEDDVVEPVPAAKSTPKRSAPPLLRQTLGEVEADELNEGDAAEEEEYEEAEEEEYEDEDAEYEEDEEYEADEEEVTDDQSEVVEESVAKRFDVGTKSSPPQRQAIAVPSDVIEQKPVKSSGAKGKGTSSPQPSKGNSKKSVSTVVNQRVTRWAKELKNELGIEPDVEIGTMRIDSAEEAQQLSPSTWEPIGAEIIAAGMERAKATPGMTEPDYEYEDVEADDVALVKELDAVDTKDIDTAEIDTDEIDFDDPEFAENRWEDGPSKGTKKPPRGRSKGNARSTRQHKFHTRHD